MQVVVDARYYLFVQVYSDLIRQDACPVGVAVADSPLGPFELQECGIILQREAGDWDDTSIHDPYPLIYKGKVHPYYKGAPSSRSDRRSISLAQGVTIGESPDGLNFELKAIVDMPPNAGGPFIPDLTADQGDGRGILWGLSIGRPAYSGVYRSRLLRFDCSLSRDVERPSFKGPKDYSDTQFLAFPQSSEDRVFFGRVTNMRCRRTR